MENISFITKELLTKEKIEEILKSVNLSYELGGSFPYENLWVKDSSSKAILVVNINDLNDENISLTEKEALREFDTANVKLPFENAHILDVEYDNYEILEIFKNALKKLYPDTLYYDDERNKFFALK